MCHAKDRNPLHSDLCRITRITRTDWRARAREAERERDEAVAMLRRFDAWCDWDPSADDGDLGNILAANRALLARKGGT